MRCGGPVAWNASVCRRCNPADLPSPSRTQYHATMLVAIFVPLLVFGVWLVARG
jgi:hypothetical protein